MTRVLVQVDPLKCGGSGCCVALAPDHFELGELGYSVPVKPAAELVDLPVLREAEENCPYGAITLFTADA